MSSSPITPSRSSLSERDFPIERDRRDGKVQILTGEILPGIPSR